MESNMSPLTVRFTTDRESESCWVTLVNEGIEFSFNQLSLADYLNASRACEDNSEYISTERIISVKDGVVTVSFENYAGHNGGHVKTYLPAKLCAAAFKTAHDALQAFEAITNPDLIANGTVEYAPATEVAPTS